MRLLAAGLLFLALSSLVAPAAAQACQAIPKQISGKVLPSADGAAGATSPGFTVKATVTRTGAAALSTARPQGSYYFFDAGSFWGNWCVGDTVQVAVTVSPASGTYSAVVTKSITTDNPELFPDATLAPGEPPTPPPPASATPAPAVVPTPAPSIIGSSPGGAPSAPPATPTPSPTPRASPGATAAPSRATAPAATSPPPAPGAPSPSTPAPGILPPVPAGPARSPGFELIGAVAGLCLVALFAGRRR